MTDIIKAINQRNYLEFDYNGKHRKVLPFAYGPHVDTREKKLRGLQVEGGSASGEYKMSKLFDVDKIKNLKVLEEVFTVPDQYRKGDKHISPIEAEL